MLRGHLDDNRALEDKIIFQAYYWGGSSYGRVTN